MKDWKGHWENNEKGWWYVNRDGSYPVNNWQQIDSLWSVSYTHLDVYKRQPWTSIYSMEQRPVNVIVYRYLIWLINCVKDLGETGGALREQGFSMIFFYTTGTRTPGKQEIISMALPTRGQPWKMQNSILN